MTSWTVEQQAAIEARNSNLLVAAAAGSGKTAVLVERIIRLIINEKIDIDKILIVTFTQGAAGEMRERISGAIISAMDQAGHNEEYLRRQLNLLSRASISTIHAFCTEVITRYFYYLDIDPDFRIGDEAESKMMKWEAMEELFESEYDNNAAFFLVLVEMFAGSRNDGPLQELILRLYNFIQSQPYPLEWLRIKIADFDMNEEDFYHSEWVLTLLGQIKIELLGAQDSFAEAIELANSPDGPTEYIKNLEQDLHIIEVLLQSLEQGWDVFHEAILGISFSRLPGKVNSDCRIEIKEACQAQRQEAKGIIDKIKKNFVSRSLLQYLEDLHELSPVMQYLGYLVEKFTTLYQAKKNAKGIVDFNDLEHYALEVLGLPEVAREYRQKFEYIFVDEYQDSNGVQETLINFIKRENNLFFVGDVKQSIYRFRLADPGLFLNKYFSFDKYHGALNRCIDLRMNFRSCPNILAAVNYIFNNIMSRDLGEIIYDNKAALYPGKEDKEEENNKIEFCLLEKKNNSLIGMKNKQDVTNNNEKNAIDIETEYDDLSFLEDLSEAELEAHFVVTRIKELLLEKIYDEKLGKYRHLNYRDIVVLMRATSARATVFLEIFMAEGIPAYADINSGYFKALEISIFMNLLRIIDNKRQDVPLLSILRSSIGGFTVDDLINIRMLGRDASTFYEAIEQYINKNDDDLKKKLIVFLNKIDSWRDVARYLPIDEFISHLFKESGYYYYVSAMPGGIQRQANLRILLDRARQYHNTSLKGLFNFIKFIDKLESNRGGDMGMAKILGENDNVVRIMSIHKSKGLEFPAVIITGLGRQFNRQDTNNVILFHKDLGIGPRYINLELRGYRDTIARMSIQNRIKIEALSEEMRILYVGLTRAKSKLILLGSVKELEKAASKWSKNISAFSLSHAQNFLDWIGPVVFRHRDGEILRHLSENEGQVIELINDESQWDVKIMRNRALVKQDEKILITQVELKEKLLNFVPKEISAFRSMVEKRLDWKYGWENMKTIPSNLSVTQVKDLNSSNIQRALLGVEFLLEQPKFLSKDRGHSAEEKGSIIHLVMKYLNLQRINSVGEISNQINEMVIKGLLSSEEALTVEVRTIMKFFQSNLGHRLLTARRVYRETPFNLVCSAQEIISDLKNVNVDENLLIQGVIDLYFYEGDSIVLVDYKTDIISGDKKAKLICRYGKQMDMYRYALEKISNCKVKDSYFYLLSSSEAVEI